MLNTAKGPNDTVYYFNGNSDEAAAEYERFQGCLLQLMDESSDIGDLEDKWVIFKDGWVYGLSAFDSQFNASAFARQIFRDEPNATYIVAQVKEEHALSAMHLLASALSDVESIEMRKKQEEPANEQERDDQ